MNKHFSTDCSTMWLGPNWLFWKSSLGIICLISNFIQEKNARLLKHHDQHIIFLGHHKVDLTPTSVSSILWEQKQPPQHIPVSLISSNIFKSMSIAVLLCKCCKCFAGVGKKYCYCRNVEGFLFGAKCHFHQTTYWSSTRCIKTRRGEWCERTREEEAMLFL